MDRFVDVALSQAKAAYVFRAAANKTFRMTAEQMSYYYGRPVVHCYLLHAEWPAERAAQHPDADRSLDRELIKATLQAAHDVQRHLLDLLEEKPGEAPASGASPNGVSSARTAP
jgi:hypothetical protein